MASAYYNEHDPKAAAWLRELIRSGHIAAGDVDERSIEDVRPSDLRSYSQCHFFAGIGGWSLALRMAGWDDSRPVWTGSCPCQPFSSAGKGRGFADDRHLWPAFFWLIQECRPAAVFGEQVASADGLKWLDAVRADLEGARYALGAADLCAAGIGAPHIRQRLYWVADAHQHDRGREATPAGDRQPQADGPADQHGGHRGAPVRLADAGSERFDGFGLRLQPGQSRQGGVEAGRHGEAIGLGDADIDGAGRNCGAVPGQVRGEDRQHVPGDAGPSGEVDRPGPTNGHWRTADWLGCRDGRWRPVEPGTQPLADGLPGRVGLLRGYGNAIVPQVAAAFIEASGLISIPN